MENLRAFSTQTGDLGKEILSPPCFLFYIGDQEGFK